MKVWDIVRPRKTTPHMWAYQTTAPKTIHIKVTEPDDELIEILDEWLLPDSRYWVRDTAGEWVARDIK